MPRDNPNWIIEERRELGERIRALRMEANHTQEHFAEITGIDRRTLQRIERGESDPRYGHLLRIAAALNTHISAFVP